jgi:hypothetical protein
MVNPAIQARSKCVLIGDPRSLVTAGTTALMDLEVNRKEDMEMAAG